MDPWVWASSPLPLLPKVLQVASTQPSDKGWFYPHKSASFLYFYYYFIIQIIFPLAFHLSIEDLTHGSFCLLVGTRREAC